MIVASAVGDAARLGVTFGIEIVLLWFWYFVMSRLRSF